MPTPRHVIVDSESSGFYHCVSRCVRRAFLCGNGYEHRREWIEKRLRVLARAFAIDVTAFAVMSNHLHVVVRTAPSRATGWSDREVARRWLRVFPGRRSGTSDAEPSRTAVDEFIAEPRRVATARARLASLSWFMKSLKEPIARMANAEDGVTGHFWEGRFRSHRVLDLAALLATMVYVDLNVMRAGLAATPEQSRHSSVFDRIQVRHRYRKALGLRKRAPRHCALLVTEDALSRAPRHGEDGIWLAPIQRCRRIGGASDIEDRGLLDISVDDYLLIVDQTGRVVDREQSATIPTELSSILDRLQLDVERWVSVMAGLPRLFGTVVGSTASRAIEAARRGMRRVCDVMHMDCPM